MKDIQVSKDWLEPRKEDQTTRVRLVPSPRVISVEDDIADAAVKAGAAEYVQKHEEVAAKKADKADDKKPS